MKLIETLEIFLIVHRSHKCKAFPIWKKCTDGLPYLPEQEKKYKDSPYVKLPKQKYIATFHL
jgi:hypothetical protein